MLNPESGGVSSHLAWGSQAPAGWKRRCHSHEGLCPPRPTLPQQQTKDVHSLVQQLSRWKKQARKHPGTQASREEEKYICSVEFGKTKVRDRGITAREGCKDRFWIKRKSLRPETRGHPLVLDTSTPQLHAFLELYFFLTQEQQMGTQTHESVYVVLTALYGKKSGFNSACHCPTTTLYNQQIFRALSHHRYQRFWILA